MVGRRSLRDLVPPYVLRPTCRTLKNKGKAVPKNVLPLQFLAARRSNYFRLGVGRGGATRGRGGRVVEVCPSTGGGVGSCLVYRIATNHDAQTQQQSQCKNLLHLFHLQIKYFVFSAGTSPSSSLRYRPLGIYSRLRYNFFQIRQFGGAKKHKMAVVGHPRKVVFLRFRRIFPASAGNKSASRPL